VLQIRWLLNEFTRLFWQKIRRPCFCRQTTEPGRENERTCAADAIDFETFHDACRFAVADAHYSQFSPTTGQVLLVASESANTPGHFSAQNARVITRLTPRSHRKWKS
jgi:hypothetical protein